MKVPSRRKSTRPTYEKQREHDGELVDRLAGDVLEHGARQERSHAAVGLAQKQLWRRPFRGQCQRGERVHDQVHP